MFIPSGLVRLFLEARDRRSWQSAKSIQLLRPMVASDFRRWSFWKLPSVSMSRLMRWSAAVTLRSGGGFKQRFRGGSSTCRFVR